MASRHIELAYEPDGTSQQHPPTLGSGAAEAALAGLPVAGDGAAKSLADVAVLPEPGDNCAIVRGVMPRGTLVTLAAGPRALSHTLLEGHRFAVVDIQPGEPLLSWGLPFGIATAHISPGEYIANASMLETLAARGVDFLPAAPNFRDRILPFTADGSSVSAVPQVPLEVDADARTFLGFARPGGRGVGTRNYIALIGTTSSTAGYVRALEARVRASGLLAAGAAPGLDGVCAIAHTEGAGDRAAGVAPNNLRLLTDTLVAYIAHPNVGAALVVDYGSNAEALWGAEVRAAAAAGGVDLSAAPHAFATLSGDLEADLAAGLAAVAPWVRALGAAARTPQPIAALAIAQQCGGSDAFSGVSGNPCAGEAARLLIGCGGAAVLAETDELIGAEAYVLRRVRDAGTAHAFLGIVERFKARLAWHGQTAEANPTGGNKFRGLYNIGLKSLGAGKKKHADVRLDGVLEYSERLAGRGRGYYMMDSPGNDLESIAGQVATGCNVIHFITGNGSITNFPFVPTIKIVTTSARFELLKRDMDFNAGRFQDAGVPMTALGAELHALTVAVASGQRTVGERAGHAQVAVWRNWPQSGPADLSVYRHGPREGAPLALAAAAAATAPPLPAVPCAVFSTAATRGGGNGCAAERVALLLPTSLCAGEVAALIATRLNAALDKARGEGGGGCGTGAALAAAAISRFVSLPHTEGCCTGYAEGGIALYARVMLGHLTHPAVALALCLEHGCEKTHNDWFAAALAAAGVSPASVGFASIQLDGGIEAVAAKVADYFAAAATAAAASAGASAADTPAAALARAPADARRLTLGLLVADAAAAAVPEVALAALEMARALAAGGGCLVVPASSALLAAPGFAGALLQRRAGGGVGGGRDGLEPTLAFAQTAVPAAAAGVPAPAGGVHVMDTPLVSDFSETVCGLAAAGAHAVLVLSTPPARRGGPGSRPVAGHPLVPVLHVGCNPSASTAAAAAADCAYAAAVDALLTRPPGADGGAEATARAWAAACLKLLAGAVSGTVQPVASRTPVFSVARGPTGCTT